MAARGSLDEAAVEQMASDYRALLDRGACVVKESRPMGQQYQTWVPFLGHDWDIPYA